jgi:hypothetical protein
MSSRTSHRRAAAGKKSRQEKYLPGEKSLPAKNPRAVRFPDKNRDWDSEIVTAFAACEKCFGYSLTANGLCWSCKNDGAA